MSAMLFGHSSDPVLAGPCPNGTLCGQGMTREPDLTRDPCPAGSWCDTGAPWPTPCAAGRYNPFPGAGDAGDCFETPRGYYTVEGSKNFTGLCAPGYYCPPESTTAEATPCPATTYNPFYGKGDLADCSTCVAGGYCPQGSAQPQVCPRGYYCITGVSAAIPCPPGTFGNQSGLRREEDCSPCSPGMYCDGTGIPRPRGQCDPGFYCIEGSNTSAPNAPGAFRVPESVGGICPPGGYCPQGSSFPSPCPAGTFGNTTGLTSEDDCTNCLIGYYCSGSNLPYPSGPCLAGYFCTSGSLSPTQNECPAGTYSDVGSGSCTECSPGRWQPYKAQSSCVVAPAGYYAPDFGMTTYFDCPQGYYCPEGIEDFKVYPCPFGTFGGQPLLQAVSGCSRCSAGQYCGGDALSAPTGDCQAGYYCTVGVFDDQGEYCFDLEIYQADYDPATDSNLSDVNASLIPYLVNCGDDGGPCTRGSICYAGAALPTPCPLGTYYPTTHNTGDCFTCDPGYACDTTGLAASSTICQEGYFCRNTAHGAQTATPLCLETSCVNDYGRCPVGHYCGNMTINPSECPAGRYAPVEGLVECWRTPPGTYTNGTTPARYHTCPRGTYCPSGSTAPSRLCPPGRYGHDNGLRSSEECAPCPAGQYCSSHGSMTPSGLCDPGYFCVKGSIYANGTTSDSEASECPAGTYCPAGSSAVSLCPIGTYGPLTRQSDLSACLNCTRGRYCDAEGLAAPTADIDPGYYAGYAVTTARPLDTVCPRGSFCPNGATRPTLCAPGSFASLKGLEQCVDCPPGFACALGAIDPVICDKGYYCPLRSSSVTEIACPAGYWSNKTGAQALGDCLPIPPGHYALGTGNFRFWPCDPGYYCTGLATSPRPPTGSSFGGPCGGGSMCYAGSTTDVLCSGGSYCDGTQIVGPITAGYWSIRNASVPTPAGIGPDFGVSPQGHYAPRGSITPTSCSPGKFLNYTGATNETDCMNCLRGFVCPNASTTHPSILCSPGRFCPSGSIVGEPCPPGSRCPEGVGLNISCDAGRYQPLPRQARCLETPRGYFSYDGATGYHPCPQGFVCPPGTADTTMLPCPNGTFSNWTRLYDLDQCTPCLPGFACNATGLTAPVGPCAAGHFCQYGAIIASPSNTW